MLRCEIDEGERASLLNIFEKNLQDIEKWYFYSAGGKFSDYVIYFEKTWSKSGLLYRHEFFFVGVKQFYEMDQIDEDFKNLFWYAAFCVSRVKTIISRKDWPALSVPVDELKKWNIKFDAEIKRIIRNELSRCKSKAAKSRYTDLGLLKNRVLDYFYKYKDDALDLSISRFFEKHIDGLDEVVEPFRVKWNAGDSSYNPPSRENIMSAVNRWRSDDDFRVGMDNFFNLKIKPRCVVLKIKK